MRIVLLVLAPAILLAGCDRDGRGGEHRGGAGGGVHVAMDGNGNAQQIAIKVPGLDGKVELPSFNFGRHVDLDGIRLAANTTIRRADITADDDAGDDGRLRLTFINPAAPAGLIEYYAHAARAAGYQAIAAGPTTLDAAKGGTRFTLAVSPDGGGSAGTITMHKER